MNEKKIGIKVADGTFYPVLEENSLAKKRLILTTVKDGQKSVQINLYKGIGDDFKDPVYVGSLLIENVAGEQKGVPEIELVIGFDDENILSAKARDLASGEEEMLNVSIESLDEEPEFEVPEFSLEDDFDEDLHETDEFISGENPGEGDSADSFDGELEEESKPSKKRLGPFAIVLLVILSLAILGGLVYFLYDSFSGSSSPSLQADKGGSSTVQFVSEPSKEQSSPGTKTLEPVKTGDAIGGAVKSVSADKTSPPQGAIGSEAKKEASEENIDKGVWYRIRWGDTLWGISYSFYKSPMLYAKIAKKNKIKNPDLIFAASRIFIPEE